MPFWIIFDIEHVRYNLVPRLLALSTRWSHVNISRRYATNYETKIIFDAYFKTVGKH